MSGGAFEYNQYQIRMIWEEIQEELDKQGQEKEVQFFEKLNFVLIEQGSYSNKTVQCDVCGQP